MSSNKDLWKNIYSPKKISDFKGNQEVVKQSIIYINSFATMSPTRKYLLFSGPAGVGKTTLSKLLASASGVESNVIDCSTIREYKGFTQQIKTSISEESMGGGKIVVILDEIDGQSKAIKNFEFLSSIKDEITNPIILIANNFYKLPRKFIDESCIHLKFSRPYKSTIKSHLIEISNKENMVIPPEILDSLSTRGDLRSCITALQIYKLSGVVVDTIENDKEFFECVRDSLIKGSDVPRKLDTDDLINWIEENGRNFVSGLNTKYFYEIIIKAEKLRKNHRNGDANKILGKINSAIDFPFHGEYFLKLQKPEFIHRLFLSKLFRKKEIELSRKLKVDFPYNLNEIHTFLLPTIVKLASIDLQYASFLYTRYDLSKNELALIMNTTINDPRINRIIQEPYKLRKKIEIQSPSIEDYSSKEKDFEEFFS